MFHGSHLFVCITAKKNANDESLDQLLAEAFPNF